MKIGNEDETIELIHTYWNALEEKNWSKLKSLFAEDFEAYWPQSHELFKSASDFIEMNRNYPGSHKFEFYNSTHSYDQWDHRDLYVSEIKITSTMADGKTQEVFAVSHFEIEDGRIISMREYWADCYAPPEWRQKWVKAVN